jgi:hypothetical protein
MFKAVECHFIVVHQARLESLDRPEFPELCIVAFLRAEMLKAVIRRCMAFYQARLE